MWNTVMSCAVVVASLAAVVSAAAAVVATFFALAVERRAARGQRFKRRGGDWIDHMRED